MVGTQTFLEVAGGAVEVYGLTREVKLLHRLLARFRRKKRILVLGASGVGKTQFINSILNVLSDKLTTHERTAAVHGRKVLIDERPFLLFDTPGQRLDEAKRRRAILDAVRSPLAGIINVVSFGYHEAAEAGPAHALPKKGRQIAEPGYLKARREIELELLSEWVPTPRRS